jgi:RNA polymerase sigma-70 factor (ECF subfamily)
MSDDELIARIAKGDAEAFADFYDRHAARVLGLLIRILRDRRDAEDVLQHVYWQVWRNASRYSVARGTPEVWLFLIARSRAIDLLRNRKREAEQGLPNEPIDSLHPIDSLEREDRADSLRIAMSKLPAEQRSAIALAFYQGMTHEQVASCQAIPLGTAKTRIRSGLRRLRELLGAKEKELTE